MKTFMDEKKRHVSKVLQQTTRELAPLLVFDSACPVWEAWTFSCACNNERIFVLCQAYIQHSFFCIQPHLITTKAWQHALRWQVVLPAKSMRFQPTCPPFQSDRCLYQHSLPSPSRSYSFIPPIHPTFYQQHQMAFVLDVTNRIYYHQEYTIVDTSVLGPKWNNQSLNKYGKHVLIQVLYPNTISVSSWFPGTTIMVESSFIDYRMPLTAPS